MTASVAAGSRGGRGLGLVRGRVGPPAPVGGHDRAASTRAGRHPRRASLRLPPRRTLAGRPRGRARGRLGRRALAELVLISGDLLTHPRGERKLRELVERIPGAIAVLGNHDFGDARDPLASPSRLDEIEPARLLGTRKLRSRFGGGASRSSASTRARTRAAPRGRTSAPTMQPTCASSSATTRSCSTACPRARSTSC